MKRFLLVSSICLTLAFGFAVSGFTADGQELYRKCAGCHGADGGKFKSKAEADILAALNGYREKTFGGDKKAIMESIAKNLSPEDIQTLAKYISTL
ncbi:c-type cytochrome [Fundidesulfovibrio soli]|uniref:c-type cytochrome n=1 Tax=Fundidesulfovibrio soli TaxID=2922716 RepID=UPI001FAEFAF1|nr:c-type cytochrome [Fundidesulfovibrio soli]